MTGILVDGLDGMGRGTLKSKNQHFGLCPETNVQPVQMLLHMIPASHP